MFRIGESFILLRFFAVVSSVPNQEIDWKERLEMTYFVASGTLKLYSTQLLRLVHTSVLLCRYKVASCYIVARCKVKWYNTRSHAGVDDFVAHCGFVACDFVASAVLSACCYSTLCIVL